MKRRHSSSAAALGAPVCQALVCGLALASAAAAQGGPAAARSGVAVDPAVIVSGMLYSGSTVRVSTVVAEGDRVAIVCRSEDHPLVLNRKGKVLGLIWMNVGKVSFEHVPEVYLLRTSDPVDSLAPAALLREAGVGFGALAARSGLDTGRLELFDELVRLKQRDRVWGVATGAVHLHPAQGGTALATTDFALPARAGPGTYRILVYTFRNGRGRLADSAGLSVREGGGAAFITMLAKRHGLLYGFFAALVAVAVGLLTGLVFGLGSKH